MFNYLWIFFTSTGRDGKDESVADPPQSASRSGSQSKVNPYSVIEINPLLHQLPEQQREPLTSAASPTELKEQDREAEASRTSPAGNTSVYSVPVPPGYATPSNVPLITPAYTTPVIIRHLSVDDDGKEDYSAWKVFIRVLYSMF